MLGIYLVWINSDVYIEYYEDQVILWPFAARNFPIQQILYIANVKNERGFLWPEKKKKKYLCNLQSV